MSDQDPGGDRADPALAPTVSSHRGASAAPQLAIGQRLGERYVVRAFLGEGGMGAVYRALDEKLGEEVALKLVRGTVGASERLRDEVRLAQKVTHPNVCRTYDLEEVDGLHLVKMEHVAGESLAQCIAREGTLPVDRALAIARGIASGLAAAHARGIVHRDLKPGNVMLEGERVVLMDFGLAQLVSAGEGIAAGTPGYMAPEQIENEELDARTDLYALGCVLYEMLAGKPVFTGTLIEVQEHHLRTVPPDIRTRRADVPRWLARAIADLLAKEPSRRSQGAALLDAGPARWRYVAAAAVLAVGGGVAVWMLARPPEPWRPTTRSLAAHEEEAGAATLSPDRTRIAYAADADNSGFSRIYIESLDGTSRAITEAGENYYYPEWQDARHVIAVAGPPATVFRIDVDSKQREEVAKGGRAIPCGSRLLLREDSAPDCRGCSRFMFPATGEELVRFPAGERVEHFRCDPTGRRIAYSLGPADGVGQLWILELGQPPRRLTNEDDNQFPTFVRDGRSIVFSSRRGGRTNIWEIPVSGGTPRQITTGNGPDTAPDISSDGRWLLYSVRDATNYVFEYRPGAASPRRLGKSGDHHVRGVTADGRVLVTHREAGFDRLALLDKDGGLRTLGVGNVAALAPNGREVIVANEAVLASVSLADGSTRRLAELPGRVERASVAADGTIHLGIAKGDDLEAWRVPPGGKPAREAGRYYAIMPAPDGGWTAALVTAPKRELHLFAPGTAPGETPAVVLDFASDAVWSPDGLTILTWDRKAVRRYTLATGDTQLVIERSKLYGMALASDGTIYLGQSVSRARREIVTNFDRR